VARLAGLALVAVALLAAAAALDRDHRLTEPARAGVDANVRHFRVSSPFVPGVRRETLVLPRHWRRGGPLLLWLHARGGNEDSLLTPSFFAALKAAGHRAPAVLIASDNRFSFWHDRRGYAWDRYLLESVLPRGVTLANADPARIAVGGISMGGFGAYNLARLVPGRFCAVGAHSPAIFRRGEQRLARSFDDGRDFRRNDLLTLARRDPLAFRAPRLWLDVGTSDRFAGADRTFAGSLRGAGLRITTRFWPGGHAPVYWHAHFAAYLRFYADALARCHPAQ
jgi:S-formylglutathione hydrolase FrmB